MVRAVICVLSGMKEEEGHLQLRIRLRQGEDDVARLLFTLKRSLDVADDAWVTDLYLRKQLKKRGK